MNYEQKLTAKCKELIDKSILVWLHPFKDRIEVTALAKVGFTDKVGW